MRISLSSKEKVLSFLSFNASLESRNDVLLYGDEDPALLRALAESVKEEMLADPSIGRRRSGPRAR